MTPVTANPYDPPVDSPKLHHVVFCVRPENQDRAAALWLELGLTFQELPLAREGLRVLLDWSAGIEIISPTEVGGTESSRFRAFLDTQGEGVYSVVVRTAQIAGPIAVAASHGADVRYQQHREHGDLVIDEADLAPVHGMPLTLLATNRPD
jgi:hypothetical protein